MRAAALVAVWLGACGGASRADVPDAHADVRPDAGPRPDAAQPAENAGPRLDLPYATSVERFEAGTAAGFGQDNLPGVVLGPPEPPAAGGSLHVLSLGVGGEIVLGFEPRVLVDGPGPDLIVFENAFYVGGDRSEVFAEAGEVSVSEDGTLWHTFDCDAPSSGNAPGPGCAGGRPAEPFDPEDVVPLDPAQTGGDPFDLADLGVSRARFVRIVDRASDGSGRSAGFDLDAVGLVHFEVADDDRDAGREP